MAQSEYQQLAGEVMKNGGSMKDAGKLWKQSGRNLQLAQQMLRKGGKNKRNMRGGSTEDDSTSEQLHDDPNKLTGTPSGTEVGESNSNPDDAMGEKLASDSGFTEEKPTGDAAVNADTSLENVSSMISGLTSMMGGKRKSQRRNKKGGKKQSRKGGRQQRQQRQQSRRGGRQQRQH